MGEKRQPKKLKQDLFLAAYFHKLTNISSACEKADISRSTYYKWMTEKIFRKRFEDAVASLNDNVRQVALRQIMKGDKDLIKFWLKTQQKKGDAGLQGFVEKQEVTHSGSVTNVNLNTEMTKEDIDSLLSDINESAE